jgi:cytochrome c5
MMKTTNLILATALATLLAACGGNEKATEAADAAATVEAVVPEEAVVVNEQGESIYKKVCAMCHAANVAGAPKPGDKADWEPRMAQGIETLHKHAIEGFTGTKGMMPARGGSPALTDDEVKSAVDYMVAMSK